MSTAKIIPFSTGEDSLRTSVPELLKSGKQVAEKRLQSLLDTMFNNADDCLFEYADKASNNEQQTTYMDAMRELRIKKPKILQAFFNEFDQLFYRQFSDSPATFATTAQAPAEISLSLVEEDDLEESLAITNMVNRVYSECREPLTAMVVRINEVYKAKKFSKESNPFCPTLFCEAFSQATHCLATTLEIKLIVYKLFDKYVMHHIGKMYHEINDMLVAAGVLPTIKYKMPAGNNAGSAARAPQPLANSPVGEPLQAQPTVKSTARTTAQSTAQQAIPAANSTPVPAVVFETMRQALYQHRGQPLPQGQRHGPDATESAAAGSTEPGTSAAPGGGIYYVTSDIIAGLSSIQNNTAIASFHAGTANSGEVIKGKVLNAVAQAKGGVQDKSLNNSDADVIDIVSMMFDYILNDKSLPDRTKAVIARLQIPMVKVAIMDKTFFSKKTHPARALLNELAYASNVLDSEYDDADTLFAEVERVVARVLNEFTTNIDLFSRLLAGFQKFLEEEVQSNKLAEQLVLDTKQNVADEIEKRLLRHSVPPAVKRFILGPWKQVLNTIGIRDHCEGIAWSTATLFMDDLIWSVQPKLFSEDRKQLSQVIPRLLPSLREGLALLEHIDFDISGFMQELQQIHLKVLHVAKPLGYAASNSHPEQRRSHSDSDIDEFLEDMSSQGNKHDRFEFDMNDPQLKQSRYFQAISSMNAGTWVEFDGKQGKKRGKLTWKCDFTGEYTFMNRMYKVVADLSMRELITQMDNGQARIVEDIALFDRAVNAIISSVKQISAGNVQARPAAH